MIGSLFLKPIKTTKYPLVINEGFIFLDFILYFKWSAGLIKCVFDGRRIAQYHRNNIPNLEQGNQTSERSEIVISIFIFDFTSSAMNLSIL